MNGQMGLGFVLNAHDFASPVFKGVGGELDKLSGRSSKVADQMTEVGATLKSVGTKMMMAGAAGAVGLGVAANAAAEYGKQVGLVQTIADKTQFPLEKIKNLGFDMAQAYGGDAKTQLAATYNALSSGASTAADATALLNAANKLAVAGNGSVDSAMAGLTGTINAYGMAMTDAATVSDSLFMAVNLGAADMSIETLSTQFSGVSATAHTFGISLNETLAGVAKLTASGTLTSAAVTELKAVMSTIAQPTADAAKEAKRLGISFDMAALKSKGLAGLLDSIKKSGKETPETMHKLFGASIEAFSGVSKLYGDGGDAFREFSKKMNGSAGAATDAFNIMSQTAAFAGAQLKANLGVALIKIGDAVGPVVAMIGKALNMLVMGFNNLPAPVQKALVLGFAAASAFLMVGGAVLVAVGSLMALASVGTAAGIAIGAVTAIVEVMTVALAVAGAAIATISAGIEADLGGFGKFAKESLDQVKLAFGALGDLFSTGAISGPLARELYKAENDGLFQFVKAVYLFGSKVLNFFENIGAGVSEGLQGMAEPFEDLKTALMTLVEAFGFVPSSAEESASSFATFGAAGRAVADIIVQGARFIVSGLTTVVNFLGGFVNGFKTSFGIIKGVSPIMLTLGSVINMVGSALAAFGSGSDSAAGGAQGFGDVIGRVAGAIVGGIGVVINVLGTMISFAVGVFSMFGSLIQGVIGVVGGMVNIVAGIMTGNWSRVWLGAKQIVAGVLGGIVGAVMSAMGAIAAVIDGAARLAGKDLGLQRGLEASKGAMNRSLRNGLGLNDANAITPMAPPPVNPNGAKPGEIMIARNIPPSAPMPATATTPGGAAGTPGTAAAGAPAGASAADLSAIMSKQAAPPPVNVNTSINLTVDGAVLAETVDKYSTANGGRANGAQPASK